jgi:hypothetical protein
MNLAINTTILWRILCFVYLYAPVKSGDKLNQPRARIDALLDERSAASFLGPIVFSVHSIKGDCDGREV